MNCRPHKNRPVPAIENIFVYISKYVISLYYKQNDMKKNKIVLYTEETPTSPRKVINLSDKQGEYIMKHLDRLKRDGKVLNAVKVDTVTEHDYLEYEIQNNVKVENYEECARLFKIKNETPYSKKKTRTIRETI